MPSCATSSARSRLRDDVKAVVLARRRRQFLLGRRRPRDHRPADRAGHAGPARLHPDDRRSGQGDARLPAADRRGARRRLRRRRRDPRHGLRHAARHARRRRPPSCSPASGLAGCDMGACAILPRLIGQGRASELLFTGRAMSAEEGERWGFHNRLVPRRAAARGSAGARARRSPRARPSPTA